MYTDFSQCDIDFHNNPADFTKEMQSNECSTLVTRDSTEVRTRDVGLLQVVVTCDKDMWPGLCGLWSYNWEGGDGFPFYSELTSLIPTPAELVN